MLTIKYDVSDLAKLHGIIKRAEGKAPAVINLAVNHTGEKARNAMRTALVKQTGLKRKTLVKAVKSIKAAPGGTFKIHSTGGNIRLKYFGARETRAGVTAAPWSKRRLYAGTFMKGGVFPKRVGLKMGGHVYKRAGAGRLPIEGARSGLYIAEEMIKGASEAAFNTTLSNDLPARMAYELDRIIGK